MSNKVITLLGVFVTGLVLLATTTQGCGGGGGGNTVSPATAMDLCNKTCDKEVQCNPNAGLTADQCKALACKNVGTGGAGGSSGNNCGLSASEAVSKYNACLAMACDQFMTCIENICPAGAGTAGTNGAGTAGTTSHAGTSGAGTAGAGGSTGNAGSGGAAGVLGAAGVFGGAGTAGSTCDTACTKADACCMALNAENVTAGSCTNKTTCDNAGAQTATVVGVCNLLLQGAPELVMGTPGATLPAACK
jgi:hypothetical protein